MTAARRRAPAVLGAVGLALPLALVAAPASADHIEVRDVALACPEERVEDSGYADVPAGGLFSTAISCVSAYEVARGTSSTTYAPGADVLRRQMALFLYRVGRAAGYDFDTTTDPGFSDDDDLTGETRDAVRGLANAGVAQGVLPTTYVPGATVTRGQMASFLARLLEEVGAELPAEPGEFFDDDESTVHEDAINTIATVGITAGRGGDRLYAPREDVTRQQMAAFLARTLDVLVEQGLVTSAYGPRGMLTVDQEGGTVGRGDEVTGTFEIGDLHALDALTVSGCGLDDETVALDDDGGFVLAVPRDADEGACTLTVEAAYDDDTVETFEVELTIETATANRTATSRPELVSAGVVGTDGRGTVVRYTFDETLASAGVASAADLFHVYRADYRGATGPGTVDADAPGSDDGTGDTAVLDPGDSRSVLVTFTGITTSAGADALALATVNVDAVAGLQQSGTVDDRNLVGDAPLDAGTATPSGRTAAPDLTDVFVERVQDSVGRTTAVRFRFAFDEDVYLADASNLRVVLADGRVFTCTLGYTYAGTTESTDDQVLCTTPLSGGSYAQLLGAVVGVVHQGAVRDQLAGTGPGTGTPPGSGGESNPEGAELVRGTTGTPAG